MADPSPALLLFMNGLRKIGFEPVALPDRNDCVTFDYVVQTGKFAGKTVQLGLIVPPDFPNTPPTGPHVSPQIHPAGIQGPHPTGNIHLQHAGPFQQARGGDWQYWSRPFPDWAGQKKTVSVYMSHIWNLWDTQ